MKKILSLFVLTVLVTFSAVAPVSAARPTKPGGGGETAKDPLGIDVSWPQCGRKLPTSQAFAIVGVNGGLATTTNDCLAEQLVWGSKSVGGTNQELLQLYVNTANPGGLNTPSWPKNNIDTAGNNTSNPEGTCDGSDSLACAWQYGWNRAEEDVRLRFAPAADAAKIDTNPATYIWWLDVETENTWKLDGSQFDHESNVAVLEGMTAYFEGIGIRVGLYSTGPQWNRIVGGAVASDSNLIGLDNWRPGGASLSTAKQACSADPLTTGGRVVLTQFVSKNLDYNYSCI
jgi:hypothetical protein